MRKKTKRNWSTSNKALVKRGDIFLWFDEAALSSWYLEPERYKRGRPYIYGDVAIQALLSIREVFHLTYRSLEGFAQNLFQARNYPFVCSRLRVDMQTSENSRYSDQGL